jgi:hypothetical protein
MTCLKLECKYLECDINFQKLRDPSMQDGFSLIPNQIGAYTLIEYVANITRFPEGFSVAIYKRKILLAVVNHRECTIGPGLRFGKSSEQFPSETVWHMSLRYN